MKRVLTVVGARPQFVKAAAVSRRFAESGLVEEILVHTGQHHDADMSAVFFEELALPAPSHHLGISGGGHGDMTGRMLQALEPVLSSERPDGVLVYGDTNSTLAGALAAAKLGIPVLHVEAGLRSYDRSMPEEINRRMVDHLSHVLFCPTPHSVANLAAEGIRDGVHHVGDVMLDAFMMFGPVAQDHSKILDQLRVEEKSFVLASCHRAGNVDNQTNLASILSALQQIAQNESVVFPLHPRTLDSLRRFGLNQLLAGITTTQPLGFLDMLRLERSARLIMTDSGGVQKEACFCSVPCITLRDETEWVETVESGWNTLAGHTTSGILSAYALVSSPSNPPPSVYGNGMATRRIEDVVVSL
jgi:UDP-GlcNAc3NAcA epimerase